MFTMSKRTKQCEPTLIGCQQHRNCIKSRFKLHDFVVVTTFEKTVAVNLTGHHIFVMEQQHFNGFGQINDMYTYFHVAADFKAICPSGR